jgi:anaerobic magnesium-protoporphyrin IX monomethyl ester cyclase
MASVLLLNTTQWGRGLTPIWIASHAGILKSHGHESYLCDFNFLESWQKDEVNFNSNNGQYLPTNHSYLYSEEDPEHYLRDHIVTYNPDIIMWSAVSSHIHGEGEFSSFQRGYEFLENFFATRSTCKPILIAGGIYVLGFSHDDLKERFPLVDCFLLGDSEHLLLSAANIIDDHSLDLPNFISSNVGRIELSNDYLYDYAIFASQSLLRPYHGKIVKAVDYELSRGCPFSCAYCVETIIQKFYNSSETNSRSILKDFGSYFVKKSVPKVLEELAQLHSLGINFIRFQDTNFMSLGVNYINELSRSLVSINLSFDMYIETRPESLNSSSVDAIRSLGVVGVGMGLETASQDKRSSSLSRYCDTTAIVKAFQLLRSANISRTSYNMIGLPGESADDIINTILLNRMLEPDDITCAFYTPYIGTSLSLRTSSRSVDSSQLDPQIECAIPDPDGKAFYIYLKSVFASLCRSNESLSWIRNEFRENFTSWQ